MRLRGLFFAFFLCVFCADIALAQPVPATCDPDYKAIMDARAWIGGKRDMESAQRILRKPDSTLEYSCYSFTNTFPLVVAPLNAYLDVNFGHIYLGGVFRGKDQGICDPMTQVWAAAKCQNHDFPFQTLQDMTTTDLRTLPDPCTLSSKNKTAYDTANTPPGSTGAMDRTLSFLDLMANCNMRAIPTGLIIRNSGGGNVRDAVCLAPGCYHDGSGGCKK